MVRAAARRPRARSVALLRTARPRWIGPSRWDPDNPADFRRIGVDHVNNEIVVLDRHDYETNKDGKIVREIYHGHVQGQYPSKSVLEKDLTRLVKAKMINNKKKQKVLPPPCDG
jgi:hypothetical protein